MWKKIWKNTVFQVTVALIFLCLSFVLGYKYGQAYPRQITPIVISNVLTSEEAMKLLPPKANNPNVGYFASKNGSKAYSVDCLVSSQIREENRIFFKTSEDAILSGYTLSTQTCS